MSCACSSTSVCLSQQARDCEAPRAHVSPISPPVVSRSIAGLREGTPPPLDILQYNPIGTCRQFKVLLAATLRSTDFFVRLLALRPRSRLQHVLFTRLICLPPPWSSAQAATLSHPPPTTAVPQGPPLWTPRNMVFLHQLPRVLPDTYISEGRFVHLR